MIFCLTLAHSVVNLFSKKGDKTMTARKSIGLALAISLLMVFGCGKKEMPKEIVSEKDGATMILIPAGEFIMVSPEGKGGYYEHPQHMVFLDAFYIDKYEVTNLGFFAYLLEKVYFRNYDVRFWVFF